jgi:hypothetical protein
VRLGPVFDHLQEVADQVQSVRRLIGRRCLGRFFTVKTASRIEDSGGLLDAELSVHPSE